MAIPCQATLKGAGNMILSNERKERYIAEYFNVEDVTTIPNGSTK